MIRSELGKVEVIGKKTVVMTELFELLEVLRDSLGEKAYNSVLQDVEKFAPFRNDPEQLQKEIIKDLVERILKMTGERTDGKDEI